MPYPHEVIADAVIKTGLVVAGLSLIVGLVVAMAIFMPNSLMP